MSDAVLEMKEIKEQSAFMAMKASTPKITFHDNGPPIGWLRQVDIYEDEGVWVTLDEGCNSCCHGKQWTQKAEDKFEKLGFYPEWVNLDKKSYNGIGGHGSSGGGTNTVGKTRFPYRLAGDRGAVGGCLESHE